MNNVSSHNNLKGFLVILGGLLLFYIFIPLVAAAIVIYFDIGHVLPAIVATITLSFAVILLIHRKYSIYFLPAVIIGILFLASSVVDLGFGSFSSNFSIEEKVQFMRVMRPDEISRGVSTVGFAIAEWSIAFWFLRNAKDSPHAKLVQVLSLLFLGLGLLFLVLGISSVMKGFNRL